ncbi:MAG: hypothetical protein HYV23_04465 [Deltaproteobacteria bacterium]|nr:hypothetical protein [Deltaproteobacteria bacterium]
MSLSGSSKRFFLVTASAVILAFTGCSGEKKAEEAAPAPQEQQSQQALPEGHQPVDKTQEDISKAQHANIKTQKTVSLSDEVKAKWKEVKLELVDNASGAKETVTIKVGGDVKLKEGVKLKVDALVPDYAIAENTIESRSNEARNPAVLLELVEGDKTVAKGWVFRDFPEFNSYNDGKFTVKLLVPAPAQAKK